ncbi:hypothetical protein [Methylomonas sp. MgM2]
MNNLLSEKTATFESPQGHRNGAEDVQKTKKKTLARLQGQGYSSIMASTGSIFLVTYN